jgi:hypothetical protein
VAQRHTQAALNVGDKPQRACRCHDQAQCVGADDALPSPALLLPQTHEGIGIADGNFQIPPDLVVKYQAIDIVEVILSLIGR